MLDDQRETALLRAEGVTFSYRWRLALSRVSCTIEPGITALIGANGSGKTTLLRVLAGELALREGRLAAGGDWRSGKDAGYLPQSPRLPQHFTLIEFVRYCAWLRCVPAASAHGDALEVLRSVGLLERSEDKIRELSGGMQRRAAIAAAMVDRPKVLLLDEPMNGLDPEQRRALRDVLLRLGDKGTAVVVATHLVHDLPELSPRILLLDHGRVAFAGSAQQFVGDGRRVEPSELETAFLRRTT